MLKKFLLFFCCILLFAVATNAQSKDGLDVDRYEGMASEKVFVSHNTSLLFAGEYLYYSVFCMNDKTKQPSSISTLAYVLLVAEDGSTIFKHKIGLKNSVGYGDFFISTAIPSGNYKLIGYTKWMRNGDSKLFFTDDISIVNPYRSDQKVFLKEHGVESQETIISVENTPFENDKRFIIQPDKREYAKREKVQLKIKNFRGPSGHGKYSLSVRRKSEFPEKLKKIDPISYIDSHSSKTVGQLPKYYDINFFPEEIGERIIGRVLSRNATDSLANKMVTVSIPGDDFLLKAAITDTAGFFYISIFENYVTPVAIVQLSESNKETHYIEIHEDPPLVIKDLSFKKFQIDSTQKNAVLKRSIYNQIENGFYEVRPDTLKKNGDNTLSWGDQAEHYELDDYTRFSTLSETMVEIIPYSSIRREGANNFAFNVRLFENYDGPQQNALVFIDGMFIADYNEIVEFDSKLIKSISVIRDRFELAGNRYRGMINIETMNKDYYDWPRDDQLIRIEMNPLKANKNYFIQRYGSDKTDVDVRIPDYRNQLFWKPFIDYEGTERVVEFYTSDLPGEYEIILEGFSIFGRPVLLKEGIRVK